MAENITSIRDPTVYIKPGEKLKKFCHDMLHGAKQKQKNKVPGSLKNMCINKKPCFLTQSDIEWLNQYLKEQRKTSESDLFTREELDLEIKKILDESYSNRDLSNFLTEKNKNSLYLFDLMKGCGLILPKNEVIERNPILAERVEKLKRENEEREYKAMTQNIDTNKKHFPEDSVSFQMKMMNRHLIAVGQFVVSVGAGFAFGFLGIELIVGDLSFGFRLILGITCALIIAFAEFYFLAKHLNEEEKILRNSKNLSSTSKVKNKLKAHKD